MAGYNQESEKYETLKAYRKEFAFDLPVIDAGSNANWSNGGKQEEWAIQSVFGRLNYNFKERYLFEANMRYDGTSRISSENRWGIFPLFPVLIVSQTKNSAEKFRHEFIKTACQLGNKW